MKLPNPPRPVYVDVRDWLLSRPKILEGRCDIPTQELIDHFSDWCFGNDRRYHRGSVIGRALRHFMPLMSSVQMKEGGQLVRYYVNPHPFIEPDPAKDELDDLL